MGLLRRVARAATNQRADSTEGLIINIGIINALILSFSLPLLLGVDMEVFDRLDFQYLLLRETEFRKFAIYVMDQYDTGVYKKERFNWNVIVGANRTVDVKAFLLQTPTTRPSQHRVWNVNDHERKNLMIAFEALYAHFPMWQMRVWRARNPEVRMPGGSDGCIQYLSVGTAFFVVGIMNSMFYYVSFTLSPTHEDNAKGLQHWNLFGIPMVLSLYFLSVVGVFCFFSGAMSLVYAYAPKLDQQVYLREVGFYALGLPLMITLGAGGSIALTWTSCRAFHAKEEVKVVPFTPEGT